MTAQINIIHRTEAVGMVWTEENGYKQTWRMDQPWRRNWRDEISLAFVTVVNDKITEQVMYRCYKDINKKLVKYMGTYAGQ